MGLFRLLAVTAGLAVITACSDTASPDATYENISGTYSGTMAGVSQGIGLQSVFNFTISQNAGLLSGSYSMSGNLSDGIVTVPILGSGSLDGSIGSGRNPSVNITTRTPGCPSHRENFSGTYDSANRRITMIGPVDILEDDCSVFLRYNMSFILRR